MNRLKWHDFLLIGISLALVIAATIIVVINYDKIPEKIPTNYDFSGNVTGYGSKSSIIVVLVMAFIMPAITTLCLFFPQLWNMPSVRPANLPRAEAITAKMVEGVTLIVSALLAYLTISMTGLIHFTASILIISMIAIALILIIDFAKYLKLR